MSESRAAAFEKLKIPAAKRKYILEVLEPVLEPMVAEVLGKLPNDPVHFMIDYLQKLRSSGLPASPTTAAVAAGAPVAVGGSESEGEPESSDLEVEEVLFVKKNKNARSAVSAEAYGAWNQKKEFVPLVFAKTGEQKDRIAAVLRRSFLFQNLEEKEMQIVIDAMSEVSVGPKTKLIEQGDNGDFLFLVEQGILDIWKKFSAEEEAKLVKVCEAGDTFGELSLLYNVPRAASVESRIDCVLWKLDRETFNAIVRDSASKKRDKYDDFLKSVPVLKSIDAYERSQVADALKVEAVKAGATIVAQGETGDKFYIIEDGDC